jgi:hypothetical protein
MRPITKVEIERRQKHVKAVLHDLGLISHDRFVTLFDWCEGFSHHAEYCGESYETPTQWDVAIDVCYQEYKQLRLRNRVAHSAIVNGWFGYCHGFATTPTWWEQQELPF